MNLDGVAADQALPLGVIVGAPLTRRQRREYAVYTLFKNGCAVTALWWILTHRTGWVEWSAFVLFYCLNLLGESLALHRYFAHEAFKTSTPMRYLLAALAQCGGYGSALHWVVDHRRHHSLTDRPGDVHSPFFDGQGRPARSVMKGFAHAHLGWAFDDCSTDLRIYGTGVIEDPVLRFAHRTRWMWFGISGLIVPALWGLCFGGTWQHVVGTVLIAGGLRMMLGLHAIAALNSVCHFWGYERFRGPWNAKNNPLVAFVSLGEGWHNNHHAYPRLANNSVRWWELDPTYAVILVLEMLGLVSDVQRMPRRDGTTAKPIG
jgi:stearoyl-CoA desaturase (delta-9 desaturase)